MFVAASALVEFLGSRADKAITWWPFITGERSAARNGRGVLTAVTPRNEFMPLLHIAFDREGVPTTYNPTSLNSSNVSLLIPPDVAEQVNRQAEKSAIAESARRALAERQRLQWESERPAREAAERERQANIAAKAEVSRIERVLKAQARRNVLAPVQALIDKYRLSDDDVLSPESAPSWVFQILEKMLVDDPFDPAELLQLRKSSHKYLAAAVHWRAWEIDSDPWNVVYSCSLLRDAGEPLKGVKLLKKMDVSGWNKAVASAFFTTLGGAQRDAGAIGEAWRSAETAILLRDDTPHSYLLLGALCYQLDRHEEGDDYFAKARARGATEKSIDSTRSKAESRRRSADTDDMNEDF